MAGAPSRVKTGNGFKSTKVGKAGSAAAATRVGKVAVTARPVVHGFRVKGGRVGPVRVGNVDLSAALTKRKSKAPPGTRLKVSVGRGAFDVSVGSTPHGGAGRNTSRDSMGRFT